LRRETSVTLKWIAGQLHMGRWTHIANRLQHAKDKVNRTTNMNSACVNTQDPFMLKKCLQGLTIVVGLLIFLMNGVGSNKIGVLEKRINFAVSTSNVENDVVQGNVLLLNEPTNALGYYKRGLALTKQGEWDMAIRNHSEGLLQPCAHFK
jgi:hypothetical protein